MDKYRCARWFTRRFCAWVICAASLSASSSAQEHGLRGDNTAIVMARRIIANMGGTAQWAAANWVYAREQAFSAARDSVVDAQFWRRTDAPAEWALLTSPQLRREYAWTATGGWERRDGTLSRYDRSAMQSRVGWWAGEIYVMYVRFARNDPNLRLVSTGPRSFTVLDDSDGENLGEFHVNSRGELVRWVRRFGVDSEDYIYGPLKAIGTIRVPDWGTTADGSFRFYYTDFRLSASAPNVPFAVPER